MTISPSLEELSAAQALQMKCDLVQVCLRECNLKLEGSPVSLKRPFTLRVSHSSTANAIIDDLLQIEVRFSVKSYDSSEIPVALFTIDCTFSVDYTIEDKTFQPSPESVAAFKAGNAVFNCWPYAREFVQNVTSRMGLNPPPLSFLRVIPKAEPTADGHDSAPAVPAQAAPARPQRTFQPLPGTVPSAIRRP